MKNKEEKEKEIKKQTQKIIVEVIFINNKFSSKIKKKRLDMLVANVLFK